MLLTRLNVKEMSGKDNLLTIIEELKIKKRCRKLFKFSMFNIHNGFFYYIICYGFQISINFSKIISNYAMMKKKTFVVIITCFNKS